MLSPVLSLYGGEDSPSPPIASNDPGLETPAENQISAGGLSSFDSSSVWNSVSSSISSIGSGIGNFFGGILGGVTKPVTDELNTIVIIIAILIVVVIALVFLSPQTKGIVGAASPLAALAA